MLRFAPASNNIFRIIDNRGSNAIMGTFAGLPEGARFAEMFGGDAFRSAITYLGGDGNDVVLTVSLHA